MTIRISYAEHWLVRTIPTETGCWEWQGNLSKHGKGYVLRSIKGGRTVSAHRYVFEYFIGPIPEGLTIDHVCNNRRCLNPTHLEPVSIQENIRRSPFHLAARTHCHNGHPLVGANLLRRKDGYRDCKTCKYLRRDRAKAAARP